MNRHELALLNKLARRVAALERPRPLVGALAPITPAHVDLERLPVVEAARGIRHELAAHPGSRYPVSSWLSC